MQRSLGTDRAKKLKLRISELRVVAEMDDLLQMPGKWEQLTADRAGQWAGRLTRNWRVIVQPEKDGGIVVLVVEIIDYH